MHIEFNTEELSDLDRRVLAVLAGDASSSVVVTVTEPAEKAAAAAKRVAAATKAAPKAAAKPEPEPEAEEAEEGSRTREDAIKTATALVAEGGASKVRAAIKEIGVAKVSDLEDDQVDLFFTLIEG